MPRTHSPWPIVQNGSQGHPIRTLQSLLRARGHDLNVDGIFGPATETAVKSFQISKGMTANGIMSALAWSTLIIQVKKGSVGDAVRGVQEEFQFRAGEPGHGLKVDGVFGPQTDSTVRGFQHALSLDIPSVVVDGIVGAVTWQALVSGMLSG
jgi:peptidoglycan hydrolase-like protein with peptidoglycan-binding domain